MSTHTPAPTALTTLFPAPAETLPLPTLPPLVSALANAVAQAGGRALLVGGFVRDLLSGHAPGDLDLEIFGLEAPVLENLTQKLARGKIVGKDFGILKLAGLDVSLPRSIRHAGRDGFLQASPWLPFSEAARRRDFTLNALACDPLTGELFDSWGGLPDLRAGILRPVAEETFIEDPLRVLRAVQFVSRFPFSPAPLTRALCSRLAPILPSLPRERVFDELKKLLLKSRWPERGLQLALDTGILQALLPELTSAPNTPLLPQRFSRWVTLRPADEEAALASGLALLLDDLTPPILPPPIQVESPPPSPPWEGLHQVLDRLTQERRVRQLLRSLLLLRGAPTWLYRHAQTPAAVRRLAQHGPLRLLLVLEHCRDDQGECTAALQWLEEQAQNAAVLDGPEPMWIQGRALTGLGLSQGPLLGKLLKRLYAAQLDRRFLTQEEGIQLAPTLLQELLQEESTLTSS